MPGNVPVSGCSASTFADSDLKREKSSQNLLPLGQQTGQLVAGQHRLCRPLSNCPGLQAAWAGGEAAGSESMTPYRRGSLEFEYELRWRVRQTHSGRAFAGKVQTASSPVHHWPVSGGLQGIAEIYHQVRFVRWRTAWLLLRPLRPCRRCFPLTSMLGWIERRSYRQTRGVCRWRRRVRCLGSLAGRQFDCRLLGPGVSSDLSKRRKPQPVRYSKRCLASTLMQRGAESSNQ